MHLKRSEMPKQWPIARKGTAYLAVASHSKKKGISILFILRDILKLARTRKEAKHIVKNGDIKINNKVRMDENFPVLVFDTISIEKLNKNYKMAIKNKKFILEEVSEKETHKKVVKIGGKKILGKGIIQMNLDSGKNFITNEKFSAGDSAVWNTMSNKIEKILPLREGANIEVVGGKHAGQKGKLKSIEILARRKDYHVQLNGKEVVLPLKTILVVE